MGKRKRGAGQDQACYIRRVIWLKWIKTAYHKEKAYVWDRSKSGPFFIFLRKYGPAILLYDVRYLTFDVAFRRIAYVSKR